VFKKIKFMCLSIAKLVKGEVTFQDTSFFLKYTIANKNIYYIPTERYNSKIANNEQTKRGGL